MSSTDSSADDHAYFQAIESSFIRWRGAPLLLSPSDWQLARQWHRQGIPLDLVLETLEEVFVTRQARGAKGKVQGLRYCAPAVEKAWSARQELTATGERLAPPKLDLTERLHGLAKTLVETTSVSKDLTDRLAALEGAPEDVEAALADLDREMIDQATADLSDASLKTIGEAIEESLAKLDSRLDNEEAARMRERLLREAIRRRLNLPVLSLFANHPG
jgi:hypothetical protein